MENLCRPLELGKCKMKVNGRNYIVNLSLSNTVSFDKLKKTG